MLALKFHMPLAPVNLPIAWQAVSAIGVRVRDAPLHGSQNVENNMYMDEIPQ